MANQELIQGFTADQQRFFRRLRHPVGDAPAYSPTAHARFLAKNHYDVVLMPANRALEKSKLYVEMYGEGVLQYSFIGSSGNTVTGKIEGIEVDLNAELTLERLRQFLPDILSTTAKRGHGGFHFVAEHLSLFEQQFADLYASLPKQGNAQKDFWLYCYYCCVTLEDYYSDDAYPDPSKAKKYRDLAKRLEHKCETDQFPIEENGEAFSIIKAIRDGLRNIAETIRRTTLIRAWLGFVNLYRILFVFSRLAVSQGLVFINQFKLLESLGQLLHTKLDLNGLISMINSPTSVFNALSVGIFEIRLFIILCEALKHVFAGDTEKEASRTKTERLKYELFIRVLDFYNDIAWSIVNTLCNYAILAGPVANWLTAAFLVLDGAALLVRLYFTYDNYVLKKEQYEHEKNIVIEGESDRDKVQRLYVLNGKMEQCEIDWQAKKAELLFCTGAAMLLAGGFSAALLLAWPAAAAISFVCCTIAVSMYLSSGKFGDYIKASLINSSRVHSEETKANAADAHSAFAWSMAKNTIMPLVMVTAFALYWPAALVLAVAYIAYESRPGAPAKVIPEWKPAEGARSKVEAENAARDDDINLMIAAPAM